MRRTWVVRKEEAELLTNLAKTQQQAERDFSVAFTMLCARHGVREASFQGLEGDMVIVETPDGD